MKLISGQLLEVVALEKCPQDDPLSMIVIAQTRAPLEEEFICSVTFMADRGELELGDVVQFTITKED